jgi:hypothetical protein
MYQVACAHADFFLFLSGCVFATDGLAQEKLPVAVERLSKKLARTRQQRRGN